MYRLIFVTICLGSLLWLLPQTAVAQQACPTCPVNDNFDHGNAIGSTNSNWNRFEDAATGIHWTLATSDFQSSPNSAHVNATQDAIAWMVLKAQVNYQPDVTDTFQVCWYERYNAVEGSGSVQVMASVDYTGGDPNGATWTSLATTSADNSFPWRDGCTVVEGSINTGGTLRVAFLAQLTGTFSGQRFYIDDVRMGRTSQFASNSAPVANDDAYTVHKNKNFLVNAATGILNNDTDADGDPITAIGVQNPINGSLTLDATGSFLYVPHAGYTGTDSFQYKVNDGTADSNIATVTLTVSNTPPTATDDAYTADKNKNLLVDVATGVLNNDTDLNNDGMTVSVMQNPANGTLTLDPTGSFLYVPNTGFAGTDTFTYKANDGTADSSPATVTITVANTAPTVQDQAETLCEDEPLDTILNGTDFNGDALTFIIVQQPTKGTLSQSSGGTIQYTPNQDQHGADSFTYKANDGTSDSNTASVNLTIKPQNDKPVAQADQVTMNANDVIIIDQLANDTDVDGTLNAGTVMITQTPANGEAQVLTSGAAAKQALGQIRYMPALDFFGQDTLSYTVQDDSSATSDPGEVVITINPRPFAVDDSTSTLPDTGVNISVLNNDRALGAGVTLDLTSISVQTQPQNGQVTVDASGIVIYVPVAGFLGTDTFTYTVQDDQGRRSNTATVTIQVTVPNFTPFADDDQVSTLVDTAVILKPLNNDSDSDGTLDKATFAIQTQPSNGSLNYNATTGDLTYTPNSRFGGTETVTYTIKDNDGAASNEATITIWVRPPNDDMAQARVITLNASNQYKDITGLNRGAAIEQFEHASLCGADGRTSVWWTFTATDTGLLSVDTYGSNFNTVVSIQRQILKGPPTHPLTIVKCNDDGASQTQGESEIKDFPVTGGLTYFFRIAGAIPSLSSNGAMGDIHLNVAFVKVTKQVSGGSDRLGNAPSVQPGAPVGGVNLTGATATAGEQAASCAAFDGGNSVWLTFTPDKAGQATIEAQNADFDVQMSLWTGASLESLTEIACADAVEGVGQETMGSAVSKQADDEGFTLQAGETYYIRLTGANGAAGTLDLSLHIEESVGIEDEVPQQWALSPVYPNPFNPQARFTLALPQTETVEIALYNALGQRVRTLHTGALSGRQTHHFTLDAGDLPSGTYLVRAVGETFLATRKALLIK